MNSDIKIIEAIPNGKPVRIFLPQLEQSDLARVQCVYTKTAPPKFSLIFKPGILPEEKIDTSKPCIITIDMGGSSISLEAMITKLVNPQTLDMSLKKTISHEQMREFFRVDTTTRVISKSFQTVYTDADKKPWEIQGQTVDISGSGILALFDSAPPNEHQVRLEISIPSEDPETINVLAHQVRLQELPDGRFEVAYHFDDISDEDRDKIIGCCLVIQRRMLRLKVQVRE